MKKLLTAIIMIACIVIKTKQSAGQDTHPIDKETKKCFEKDYTTAGMVNCASIAYNKWDAELNKNYKLLMSKLSEAEKLTLKNSQLAWIKYRDLEFNVLNDLYGHKEGTMYIPIRSMSRVEIVKKRALELKSYYDLLSKE